MMNHVKNFNQFLFENLSASELEKVEKLADDLFREKRIDVVFTKHFKDRVNDARNGGKPITADELKDLFSKAYHQKGDVISAMRPDSEAVIKDTTTSLNSPFALKKPFEKTKDPERKLLMKTIMRNDDFKTSNRSIVVN